MPHRQKCTDRSLKVKESTTDIVITVTARDASDGPCPAVGVVDIETVTLRSPLGDRKLIGCGGADCRTFHP